jgi:hypothetical protein
LAGLLGNTEFAAKRDIRQIDFIDAARPIPTFLGAGVGQ